MTVLEAIEASDTDELLRHTARLCQAGDWDGLVDLEARCREAVTRGKQLWGVAENVRYRLALEAPGAWAGAAVAAGPARRALGPLTEVAASRHAWSELDPYLPTGTERTLAAHERVVRGEVLTGTAGLDPTVIELPLELASWEPTYPLAVYHADRAEFPPPAAPPADWVELPSGAAAGTPTPSLYQLVAAWAEESNGRVETIEVAGTAAGAIRAIGPHTAMMAPLSPSEALAWMAWGGASGGAYGRRRGAAAGRFAGWWVVADLGGLDWPAPPDRIAEALAGFRWWWWSPAPAMIGWNLHLALEDQATGRAWALSASDAV